MREQRIKGHSAPAWGQLIAQLVAGGLSHATIGQRMGAMLTSRMLRAYTDGAQPVHFRGEALIALWCETLKLKREDVPMVAVERGHRAARPKVADLSPRMANVALLTQATRPPQQAVARQGAPRKPAKGPKIPAKGKVKVPA